MDQTLVSTMRRHEKEKKKIRATEEQRQLGYITRSSNSKDDSFAIVPLLCFFFPWPGAAAARDVFEMPVPGRFPVNLARFYLDHSSDGSRCYISISLSDQV